MFMLRKSTNTSYRFLSVLAKNMDKHAVVPDVVDVAPKEVAEVCIKQISQSNFFFFFTKLHL